MSTYHKIYNQFPYIENEVAGLILIPLINKYREVACYAVSSLSFKDKLLEFSFHKKICRTDVVKIYAVSNVNISMHELVIGNKADQNYTIDHINGDSLDNTEQNLQYATFGLNAQNRDKKPNCSSKYLGVSKDNRETITPWVVQMRINKKPTNLGSFEKEIDAAKMYDRYTIDYYKNQEPQTNNLLTLEEIVDIKTNGIPAAYRKKIRTLPKYIRRSKSNQFLVVIKTPNQLYSKQCATLADAIILKNKYLDEIKETNAIEEKLKVVPEITRNEKGLAIIFLGNKMPCVVEDDHWHDVNQYSWNCYLNSNGQFINYPTSTVNHEQVKLHRYIYEKYIGPIPDGKTVDHKDSTKILDVRLSNLRLADKSLQSHNTIKQKNTHDKYTGVIFKTGAYKTVINRVYYGTFQNAEEAAEKANQVFKSIYGDDAKLNVIDHSKKTTKHNRIPEDIITKEYIMNIKLLIDLKNVIFIKKLDSKNKGPIFVSYIKYGDMDKYKKIIIDHLYPDTDV